jgi:hypothetical protein
MVRLSSCPAVAAPEFLEKAAEEMIEELWKKVTTEQLPEGSELQASTRWLGETGKKRRQLQRSER